MSSKEDITLQTRSIPEKYGFKKLSKRELQCLYYLFHGYPNDKIGLSLGISGATVRSYIENIKFKLHCNTREELIVLGMKLGFVQVNFEISE